MWWWLCVWFWIEWLFWRLTAAAAAGSEDPISLWKWGLSIIIILDNKAKQYVSVTPGGWPRQAMASELATPPSLITFPKAKIFRSGTMGSASLASRLTMPGPSPCQYKVYQGKVGHVRDDWWPAGSSSTPSMHSIVDNFPQNISTYCAKLSTYFVLNHFFGLCLWKISAVWS